MASFTSFAFSLLLLSSFLKLSIQVCPVSCGEHGYCEDHIRCLCDKDYFGDDCSIKATELLIGAPKTSIPFGDSVYFYFHIREAPTDLKIIIRKPIEIIADIFISFEDADSFNLPDHTADDIDTIPDTQSVDNREFDQDDIEENIGRKLVFKITSTKSIEKISVEVYFHGDEIKSSAFLIIAAPIILVFISFFVVYIVIILARRHERRSRGTYEQEQIQTNKDIISLSEIQKHFPKTEFSALKSSFPQVDCKICLDDFAGNSICQQLYCEHIYHVKCIESWFEKNSTCPNCRKSMTMRNIEVFIKNQQKRKENEKIINTEMEAFIERQ